MKCLFPWKHPWRQKFVSFCRYTQAYEYWVPRLSLVKLKLNLQGEMKYSNKSRNVLLIINTQIHDTLLLYPYTFLLTTYQPLPSSPKQTHKEAKQKASSLELQHNLISTWFIPYYTPIRTHKTLNKNEYRKAQKGLLLIWENATHFSHIVRRRRVWSVLPSFLVRVWCRPSSKPSRILCS